MRRSGASGRALPSWRKDKKITPQNDSHMGTAITGHMAETGVRKDAFIGFADAYGEGWYREFAKLVEVCKISIVANERCARNDTSVTGHILKIMSTNPDAVMIAGSGTPAALPQKTLKARGYKGKIYRTHGIANNDFLRVCGKGCEGTWLPAGPLLVAEQLQDANPIKKPALAYKTSYEKAYGAGSVSTFGGHAWDAGQLLVAAVPEALKKAQPGTKEFRKALRDAIEGVKNLPVSHRVVNMRPSDHVRLDQRSRVMVQISGAKWKLYGDGK